MIAAPSEKLGEEVAVVIRFKEGKSASPEELQAFVKARLAAFKVPSTIWLSDQPLPRNATGKILKKALKEQYL